MSKGKTLNVRRMAVIGILGSISIILGITPLGFIPVGPTRATIMHIPVIVGAILEGPLVGGAVGLIFGLFSIFQAVTNPTPVSFVFLNPLISVMPRVLIGIVAYYVYKALNDLGNKRTLWLLNLIWVVIAGYLCYGILENLKAGQSIWLVVMNIVLIALTAAIAYFTNSRLKNSALDIIVATVAGTLTNTGLVLSLIYLVYAESFVKALGQSVDTARKVILGIGIANGMPEVIIAILIVTGTVSALEKRRA